MQLKLDKYNQTRFEQTEKLKHAKLSQNRKFEFCEIFLPIEENKR